MLPRMLSYPLDPIIVSYLTVLAAGLGTGTVSALSFVLDYQFVPVQVIAISFPLAAFPVLSAAWNARDDGGFRRLVVRNVLTIGGLTALAAVLLALLAEPLVARLLGGGRFDEDAVSLTAGPLVAFAITIPIDSLSPLSRALYATHNTLWQVLALGLAARSAHLHPALGGADQAAYRPVAWSSSWCRGGARAFRLARAGQTGAETGRLTIGTDENLRRDPGRPRAAPTVGCGPSGGLNVPGRSG